MSSTAATTEVTSPLELDQGPEARAGNELATRITGRSLADEVEEGTNYHVVITTTGGLYRYAMNDVVRVTGFHDGSPLIRFLYKGSHVKNIAGEMMSIDHVMTAMSAIGALAM